MKLAAIERKQAMDNLKYDTAKAIRTLLDQAREKYGKKDWDEDDIESEILELVAGEE